MLNILENMISLVDELIQEATPIKKKVIRQGKLVVKYTCPSGYKYNPQTNTCDRMSSTDIRMRSKAALKGAKVRSRDVFGQTQNLKSRTKSIKIGTSKGIY